MKQLSIIEINFENGLYKWQNTLHWSDKIYTPTLDDQETIVLKELDISYCSTPLDIVQLLIEASADAFAFQVSPLTVNLFLNLAEFFREYGDSRPIYWIQNCLHERQFDSSRQLILCPSLESAAEHLSGNKTEITCIDSFKPIQADRSEFNPDSFADTMMNGFKLLWSGRYPPTFKSTGVRHIYAEDASSLNRSQLELLTNLNSALISPTAGQFNEASRTSLHVHSIKGSSIFFGQKVEREMPVFLSYSEYKNNEYRGSVEHLAFLSIRGLDDLQAFEDDLNDFKEKKTLVAPFFLLQNECRFSTRCTLQAQPRMFITQASKVDPCGDSDIAIYPLMESEYKKEIARKQQIETARIERECYQCQARAYCTACPRLPQSITDEQYCQFMRSHPELSDFFNIKTALLLLLGLTETFNTANPADFHFSFSGHRLTYDKPADQSLDNSNIYLFKHAGIIYAFSPQKAMLAKLNERMLLLLETNKDGFTLSETQELLKEKYDNFIDSIELERVNEQLKKLLA